MGEIGEELGRVLRVLLLNIWRSLDPKTRHVVFVWAIGIGALGFLVALVQWLKGAKVPAAALARPALQLSPAVASPAVPRTDGSGFFWVRRPANPLAIPAVLLLLFAALGTWPYNFYILTRIVVCATAVLIALVLHGRRHFWWEILILLVALIFNPIAPFHFAKDVWRFFNVLAALIIAPAIFISLKEQRVVESAGSPSRAIASAKTTSDTERYSYCANCSVRVGRADLFCGRCGSSLHT